MSQSGAATAEPKPWQVRPMVPEDHLPVLAVARSLAAWFQPLDQMALAVDLRSHAGLVAVTDAAEIVGFLTYHRLDPSVAELSWFGVLPAAQGQGVGRGLLAALEATLCAEGVAVVELSTVPGDHDPTFAPTNAFYLRHGFHIAQRDEHFYAHGRPRLLFRKRLAPPTP